MAAQARTIELERQRRRAQRWKSLWAIAKRKYLGTASAVVILLFILVAFLAPVIAPYDPLEVHTDDLLQGHSATYLMGTDELGRDVLSRILYGSRVSLTVGIGAVSLGVVFGVSLGLLSAYLGGRFDLIVQRFVDALQAFPGLILALTLVAVLGQSLFNVIIAISIGLIANKCRVTRGASLSVLQNDYVLAARVIGASGLRIMTRYILPNIWAPVIVLFSISIGSAIIAETSLSFLGLGPPPPNPTWGAMISGSARTYMREAPWIVMWPGIAITSVVLAFNLLGDAIRDILDPRLRGA